jgi:hypothetical protein
LSTAPALLTVVTQRKAFIVRQIHHQSQGTGLRRRRWEQGTAGSKGAQGRTDVDGQRNLLAVRAPGSDELRDGDRDGGASRNTAHRRAEARQAQLRTSKHSTSC